MARYQMSYGFVDNQSDSDKGNQKEDLTSKSDALEAKRKAQDPPRKYYLIFTHQSLLYNKQYIILKILPLLQSGLILMIAAIPKCMLAIYPWT